MKCRCQAKTLPSEAERFVGKPREPERWDGGGHRSRLFRELPCKGRLVSVGADRRGQRTNRGSQGRGQTGPFHPPCPGRGPRRSWAWSLAGPALRTVDRWAPARQVTEERSRESGISPWVSDDSSDTGRRGACPSAWSLAHDTQEGIYAHLDAD